MSSRYEPVAWEWRDGMATLQHLRSPGHDRTVCGLIVGSLAARPAPALPRAHVLRLSECTACFNGGRTAA